MTSESHQETNEGHSNSAPECHLWLFRRSEAARSEQDSPTSYILSAEETLRAQRFRSAARRREFEESRHGIRQILSTYLKTKPADVCLTALPSGRPVVLDSEGEETLSISISHTGGLVALAIAPVKIAVGVDIEDPGNLINESAIRMSFLTDAERIMIDGCDVTYRKRLMLQIWTAKEAAFKAAGGEPSTSLMDFELEGDADSLALNAYSSLIQFCVASESVEFAECGTLSTAGVIGSFVSGRRQINASGTDVRSTFCFAEVEEICDSIVAEMAVDGVKCTMSSVLARHQHFMTADADWLAEEGRHNAK